MPCVAGITGALMTVPRGGLALSFVILARLPGVGVWGLLVHVAMTAMSM